MLFNSDCRKTTRGAPAYYKNVAAEILSGVHTISPPLIIRYSIRHSEIHSLSITICSYQLFTARLLRPFCRTIDVAVVYLFLNRFSNFCNADTVSDFKYMDESRSFSETLDFIGSGFCRIFLSVLSAPECSGALLYIPNRLDLFDLVFLLASVNAGTYDLSLLLGFANEFGFFVSPVPEVNRVGRMFGGGDVHLA